MLRAGLVWAACAPPALPGPDAGPGHVTERSGYLRGGRSARLRELESRLREERVLASMWRAPHTLCLVFSSGVLCHILLHPHTSAVAHLYFDRYCAGKLPPNPTDAVLTDTHLVFTYSENLAVFVAFNPPSNVNKLEKISSRDPNYQSIEVYGPTRKCEKHLSVRARSGEAAEHATLLVWSSVPAGELFPWSPTVRGEDRANLHVYTINRSEMSLLCYHRLEHEPLSVELSQLHPNLLYTIEQKTHNKSGVCVECCSYEVQASSGRGGVHLRSANSVVLPAPARVCRRAPCESRVALGCIDGSLLLYNEETGFTRQVKAAFIPSGVWWAEGLLVVSEERGRLQCFDLALMPLPPASPTPHDHSKLIDISQHLKAVVTVGAVVWDGGDSRRPQFLVRFEGGPLAVLRLTLADTLQVSLSEHAYDRVTSLLHALSWEHEGDLCLHILHTTLNDIFRRELDVASELVVQEALGCFHAPPMPLSPHARALYEAPLHDLTRKFFHHLVRYGRLEKALSLAVDLEDSDLFMDVCYSARRRGLDALAHEAHQHALAALTTPEHSTCSMSCCSQCSSDCESVSEEGEVPPSVAPRVAPPLPHLPAAEPPAPPAPVLSIRPSIHQYLHTDNTLWQRPLDHTPTHKVVDIIPRPEPARLSHTSLYQELREERAHTYSSVYAHKSALSPRYTHAHAPPHARSAEKNKVKFSDTVTVAVVPEVRGRKEKAAGNITLECSVHSTDPRKELADSLPLCHPDHDYLRDFAPPPPDTHPSHPSHAASSSPESKQPSKIKVVHFGMV